jgi:hypothetical protein
MSDEKNVRLYFGRKPENSMKIDDFFIGFMEKHDYLIDKAVDELIHAMKTLNISINVFHTMNPLIPNYMLDKVAIELMWTYVPSWIGWHQVKLFAMMLGLSNLYL